jgi:hypothetical protein
MPQAINRIAHGGETSEPASARKRCRASLPMPFNPERSSPDWPLRPLAAAQVAASMLSRCWNAGRELT